MCVLIRALLTAGVSVDFQGNIVQLSPLLAVPVTSSYLSAPGLSAPSSPLMESAGIHVTSFSFCSDLKKSLMTVIRQALSLPHLLLISQESLFFVA